MSTLIQKLQQLPGHMLEALDAWSEELGEAGFRDWVQKQVAPRPVPVATESVAAPSAVLRRNPLKVVASTVARDGGLLVAATLSKDDLYKALEKDWGDALKEAKEADMFLHANAPAVVLIPSIGARELAISMGSKILMPNGSVIPLSRGVRNKDLFQGLLKSKSFSDWASCHGHGCTFKYAMKSAEVARRMLDRDPATAYFASEFLSLDEIASAIPRGPLPGLPEGHELSVEMRRKIVEINPQLHPCLKLDEWTAELFETVIQQKRGSESLPFLVMGRFPDLCRKMALGSETFAKCLVHVNADLIPIEGAVMDAVIRASPHWLPNQYPEPSRTRERILKDLEEHPAYAGLLIKASRLPEECYTNEVLSKVGIDCFSIDEISKSPVIEHFMKHRSLMEASRFLPLMEALGAQRILQLPTGSRDFLRHPVRGNPAEWPRWLTQEVATYLETVDAELFVDLTSKLLLGLSSEAIPTWIMEPPFKSTYLRIEIAGMLQNQDQRRYDSPAAADHSRRAIEAFLKNVSERGYFSMVEADQMVQSEPRLFSVIPARCQTALNREIGVNQDPMLLKRVHAAHRTERLMRIANREAVEPPAGQIEAYDIHRGAQQADRSEFSF